jgi:hypothetical protein
MRSPVFRDRVTMQQQKITFLTLSHCASCVMCACARVRFAHVCVGMWVLMLAGPIHAEIGRLTALNQLWLKAPGVNYGAGD